MPYTTYSFPQSPDDRGKSWIILRSGVSGRWFLVNPAIKLGVGPHSFETADAAAYAMATYASGLPEWDRLPLQLAARGQEAVDYVKLGAHTIEGWRVFTVLE